MQNSTNRQVRTILRLFPYLKNKASASELLIDDESFYYISIREYAAKITSIIKYHLNEINIDPSEAIITDATAGVGGDTLSFAYNFKFVYSIESDKLRSDYLRNNIKIYDCTNVKVIHDDCLNILNKISNHDVVFIDPPWGGSDYKKHDTLRLYIGTESIESICNKLYNNKYMTHVPSMIVLKLPKNYDIQYFYDNINNNHNIYFYDLKKMSIFVILNTSYVK